MQQSLEPWFKAGWASKCGAWSSNLSTFKGLVSKAEPWAPAHTFWKRISGDRAQPLCCKSLSGRLQWQLKLRLTGIGWHSGGSAWRHPASEVLVSLRRWVGHCIHPGWHQNHQGCTTPNQFSGIFGGRTSQMAVPMTYFKATAKLGAWIYPVSRKRGSRWGWKLQPWTQGMNLQEAVDSLWWIGTRLPACFYRGNVEQSIPQERPDLCLDRLCKALLFVKAVNVCFEL